MAKHLPDPLHAHGAWVYLTASVAVGALATSSDRTLVALLAGAGLTGAFMVVGALFGAHLERRPLVVGSVLALGGPGAALALGAPPVFLAFALLAAVPAGAAVLTAWRWGGLSLPTIAFATLALAFAAPVTAVAGGVPPGEAALLLVLLAPFYAWRTAWVRRSLERPARERPSLRVTGLREAGRAVAWCAVVVTVVRVL